MCDVADETALTLLAGPDGVGHPVEGTPEFGDLVATRGGDPPLQVPFPQPPGGQGQGSHRAQHGPAQEQPAEDDGKADPHRDSHRGRGSQRGRRFVPYAEAHLEARRCDGRRPLVENTLQTCGETRVGHALRGGVVILGGARIRIAGRLLALRWTAVRTDPGDSEAVRPGRHPDARPGQAGLVRRHGTVLTDRGHGEFDRGQRHLPLGEPQFGTRVDGDRGPAAHRAGLAAREGVGIGQQYVGLRGDPDALSGVPLQLRDCRRDAFPGAVREPVRMELAGDPGHLLPPRAVGLAYLAGHLAQSQPGRCRRGGHRDQHQQADDPKPQAHRVSPEPPASR